MVKDIIYIMTTDVSFVIKIGKAQRYGALMRELGTDGYYNVAGFKRFFAIELEDYSDKEKLLHEIFSKHRIVSSELFALDMDLVKQLFLSFECKVIFRRKQTKQKILNKSQKSESRANCSVFIKRTEIK